MSPPSLLPLSRRRVRRVLGGLWLLDAALQAQPVMFGRGWWLNDLAGSAMGQPAAVAHSILWATGLVATHAAVWNALFVAVQAFLGVALVSGRLERFAIALSVPWAIGIWWVGEGLGALPTGFALASFGAPGPVLLYPLLGVLAWPGAADREPVGERPALVAWVLLWAGTALLQIPFRFPARQVLDANAAMFSEGLPRWLSVNAGAFMWVSAAVQVLVAIAALSARWRNPAVATALGVTAVYWLFFEHLGGVLSGGATDLSSGPLMAVLALALIKPAGAMEARAPSRAGHPFVPEQRRAIGSGRIRCLPAASAAGNSATVFRNAGDP